MKNTTPTERQQAIRAIEAVQDLYRLLGLRSEQGADPVVNFRDRLLHLSVLNELRAKSKTQADGNLDPADMSYEGVGSFLPLLMDDLAEPGAELSPNPTSPKFEPPQPQDPVSDSPTNRNWLIGFSMTAPSFGFLWVRNHRDDIKILGLSFLPLLG